jgi:hypothetical protein
MVLKAIRKRHTRAVDGQHMLPSLGGKQCFGGAKLDTGDTTQHGFLLWAPPP